MPQILVVLALAAWCCLLVALAHKRDHSDRRALYRWSFWMAALVGLGAVLAPRLALADTGAGSSAIGGDARGAIIDLILAQVVAGVGLGIKWLWDKVRGSKAARKVLDFTQQHQLGQQLAQAGVDYANELKHQAEKEGRKLVGKLLETEAVNYAVDLLRKAKLPTAVEKMLREEMIKIILARLGATRAPKPAPRALQPVA